MQEVYYSLTDEVKDYDSTVKVLDDYFMPKTNVPFERHVFRQLAQSSMETLDQFVCKLSQRSVTCEFGDKEDEYIRDQVIDQCYSSKMRRRFLELESPVTLQKLLQVTMEGGAAETEVNAVDSEVNEVRKTRGSRP